MSWQWTAVKNGLADVILAARLGVIAKVPDWAWAAAPRCWTGCADLTHSHPLYKGRICWPQPIAYLVELAKDLGVTSTTDRDYGLLKLILLTPHPQSVDDLWEGPRWDLSLYTPSMVSYRRPSQVANHLITGDAHGRYKATVAQQIALEPVFTELWLAGDWDDSDNFMPEARGRVNEGVRDAYALEPNRWHLPPNCPGRTVSPCEGWVGSPAASGVQDSARILRKPPKRLAPTDK